MATAVVRSTSLPLILVVNHQAVMLRQLAAAIREDTYQVETATSAHDALERLQRRPVPNLVLMDVGMPSADGLEALRKARELHPELKVVMLGKGNDTRSATQAVRLGALDYLPESVEGSELDALLQQYLVPPALAVAEPDDSKPAVIELSEGAMFVCGSPAMQHIYAQAALIAKFDMPVLMLGETGTGKEVLSLLVHHLSPRANHPFLKVNCAAVPADLLESELFGYEAGAFTGATKAKPGKFELCEQGTILLDEIGEMPPALQAKLLHFLQDHRFSRLGSRTTTRADVRVLAATNINIEEAITSKMLREDLYYRLSGFTMQIPPLRDRKKEIPLLLEHFMSRNAVQFSSPARSFSPRLLQACLSYSWPGNLRQLENFVRRYLVLGDEDLAVSELQINSRSNGGDMRAALMAAGGAADTNGLKSLARSVKNEAEAAAIAHALEQTNWHRQKAATMLRISYKALLYKIKQYGLHPPEAV
ncbi:MAG: sigma-54 dependent transcriptional regulator [Candidatus Korobacteraceae bacterium]